MIFGLTKSIIATAKVMTALNTNQRMLPLTKAANMRVRVGYGSA